MTNQRDFKKAAELALSHALAWRENGSKIPAVPSATTEELRALFDVDLPEEGRDGEDVIDLLAKAAANGLVGNTHPNFFAWVMGGSHPIGVAADILTSAWGQNAGLYQTTPASAIAEEVAAKWLLDLLQLPGQASVAFATGATMASFICLGAARSEVLKRAGYDLEDDGLIGAPNVHVILGEEAHTTILADLRYLGFGRKNLVFVKVDSEGRMIADDFAEKIAGCSGPKIVVVQAGHIHSGAFDPFTEIIPLAHQHNAWVHVDGAFGLWARAVPELSEMCRGVEQADSWTVDGHKWLQVPYDSGFALVKDEAAHQRAMDITASYLTRAPDDGRNPSTYAPELSRRARGFAVWAVLQALGRHGVREMVLRHCRCAQHLKQRLADVQGIRILNDVVLNQVAIAFGDGENQSKCDALTEQVIATVREENKHFVLGAAWQEQAILRVSIISRLTDIPDIDELAESILRAWERVQKVSRV